MIGKKNISGFAKYPANKGVFVNSIEKTAPFIVRGNGKSYGDVAIGDNIYSYLSKKNIVSFNSTKGQITCEAGILLSELSNYIHPKGFKLPVIPGTEHITLGGAIANDVHGKNHEAKGSFGHHVVKLKIKTTEGINTCSLDINPELFTNTIGGVGLTGIILEATIQLEKKTSNVIGVKRQKLHSIKETIHSFNTSTAEFKMAWIKNQHQILFTEGNYTEGEVKFKPKTKHISYHWFGLFTSKLVLNTYEYLLFLRSNAKEFKQHEKEFLHPLDRLIGWNNLYPKGFIQFQFVVSSNHTEKAIIHTLNYCKKERLNTFITTLKKFGGKPSLGNMSFPMEGFAFSIDIKYKIGLEKQLQNLATDIIKMGGRFYLAKDSFLNENQLKNSYATFSKFKNFVLENGKGHFISDFSKRVNIHPMSILILGANSDITKEIAKKIPKDTSLILASRNVQELNTFVNENNINATVCYFDAQQFSTHQDFFYQNKNVCQVICAFGYLGDHELAKNSFQEARQILEVNYLGAVSILNLYASYFEENQKGSIIGISSVAADRGRQSNYFYGSAKSGFDAYLSGLRNRLYHSGVHVLTVKPGFTRTKMLEGITTPNFLTNTPQQVAKRILKASKKKQNIIYVSWKWYWVMSIIKNIPEFIFKKLSL